LKASPSAGYEPLLKAGGSSPTKQKGGRRVEIIIKGEIGEGKSLLAKLIYSYLCLLRYKVDVKDGRTKAATAWVKEGSVNFSTINDGLRSPREVDIVVDNSLETELELERAAKKEGTMEIFTRRAHGTLSGADSKRVYEGLRALGFKNSVTEDYPDAIIQKWIPEDAEMPSAGAYQPLRQL